MPQIIWFGAMLACFGGGCADALRWWVRTHGRVHTSSVSCAFSTACAPRTTKRDRSSVGRKVEGRTLHAHQVLLKWSLGTDVFAAMLSHDTADSLTGRVKVEDVSFEVFSLVVRFLYTGKAEVPSELLPAVLRAARRFLATKYPSTTTQKSMVHHSGTSASRRLRGCVSVLAVGVCGWGGGLTGG